MKKGLWALVCVVAVVTGAIPLTGEMLRSYTWYGELVSVDAASKSVTVKAQVRPAVTKYATAYKPGEKLMVVWAPLKGEADIIVYAPKLELMKNLEQGYLLPVEFVSLDAAAGSLVFKTVVPDSVLQSVQSVAPGSWIKATAPVEQKGQAAVVTTAMASAKPNIVLPTPVAPTVDDAAGGRMRGRPRVDAPTTSTSAPGLPGAWVISGTLRGNVYQSQCTFELAQTKIGGMCGGNPVTGELSGNKVKFSHTINLGGVDFTLVHEGTIEEGGKSMKGTMGDPAHAFSADFSGTKS